MESGFAHMNDVTVLQAAQGLIEYLIDQNNDNNKEVSIVVGYDHRFNSQRFAELTASVAITKGVKLRTMDTKYIYSNGCQIIPPIDHGIATSIENNLQPWSNEVWDVTKNFQIGINNQLLKSYKSEIQQKYEIVVKDLLITQANLNFKFVYTPMHGVGLEILEKTLKHFNNPQYKVVEEQAIPDPTFRTVKFPNPEEKGALDLAISTANNLGYSLVIASDPDADRFSAAFKSKSGKWRQLTGNEIGFLFALYFVEEIIPNKAKFDNTYLLNSTVSSQILQAMADYHGFHFQDTLTGFKWIGNKAIDLKNEGYYVPFGYEEAIGFMFNVVNDKDGISSAVIFLQLYNAWFSKGNNNIEDKLEEGYAKYGWFKECNGYYKVQELSQTKEIFETIRLSFSPQRYPKSIGDFEVISWRDLTIGYDSTTSDNVPNLPTDPTSQMITAVLKLAKQDKNNTDQVRFTCRGSGTEPKLKVYIEGKSNISEVVAIELAHKCWQTLRTTWFKPEQNNLQETV
ncbi:Phosphoglucomutase/phosphomannomutase [Scheffersomyces amazonensis]|uniref:Phosphoglucomutase/phosphomannomutase n=1 Tax=Scheffersomyces amazonensis TaxID=1078765 RepID=UPI00315CFF3A